MISRSTFLACSFLSFSLYGQDFDNYTRITSSGSIPADFITLSSEKYQNDLEKITDDEKRSIRKSKERFYMESNFAVDDMLLSGKVLYNDPVSAYASKVLDRILQKNPDLRKKVRVYTIRSASVNAFATNNGIIFVTLGLLDKIENEAQLAFVLSHELIHFINKHPITGYVEKEKIKRDKAGYRKFSFEEKLLARSNYSKEQEAEADLEGLKLFLASGYDPDQIPGFFDVLHYAEFPFDSVEFRPSLFEPAGYDFPARFTLDSTASIYSSEDYDDSRSTHPNIRKRKEAVLSGIPGDSLIRKDVWQVSEEEFHKVRKIARFELCMIFLLERAYERAIYQAYLLLQQNPDSRYLKNIIGKALYGISQYKQEGKFWEVHVDHTDVKGKIQSLHFLIEQLDPDELASLAARFNWDLYTNDTTDQAQKLIAEKLVADLALNCRLRAVDYLPGSDQANEDSLSASGGSKEAFPLMKDSLVALNEDEEEESPLVRAAMQELLQDIKFRELFFSLEKSARIESEDGVAVEINYIEDRKVDRLVVFYPFYIRMDERKKMKVRYAESEKTQHEFTAMITNIASRLDLDLELIDPNLLQKQEAGKFNDHALLTDWISEKSDHPDEMEMISPLHNQLSELALKYNTQDFCWMGTVSYTGSRRSPGLVLLIGLLYPVILPYSIYHAVTPAHNTYYFYSLYDLSSGKEKKGEVRLIKMRDSRSVLKSNIFYTLQKIRGKQK